MLRQRVKRYLEDFNISQNEFSKRTGVSQPTISNFLNGNEITEETRGKIEQALGNYRKSVYLLTIQKDGAVKYCHSYSRDVSPETIYWLSADDERMSVPYGFRSHKQAEWFYWAWQKATGQVGWRFNVVERSM